LNRLDALIVKSLPLLDTDFFTRVGLRYIDTIPIEDGDLSGWIQETLVSPLTQGVYGAVVKTAQEVRGYTSVGHYTFRHGIVDAEQEETQTYNFDFDFYEENVECDKVLELVTQFNRLSFLFFSWAIGPKSQTRLGKATTKHRKK